MNAKKILSQLLAIVMVLSLSTAAFATGSTLSNPVTVSGITLRFGDPDYSATWPESNMYFQGSGNAFSAVYSKDGTTVDSSYYPAILALYITGGLNKNYPVIPWISDQVTVFGATTTRVTLITPVLTVAIVAALVWFIQKTKIGMAMRAASKDFETAQLMGIKINSVISFTFVIGSFLAAIGSLLFFTNYPGIVPTSGAMPGLKAFVAAVFGGIGSVPGAVLGAFIIGVCESLIKGLDTILVTQQLITEQIGFATFSDAFTFVLLIVILVFKPTGLFGEKSTDKV